MTESEIILKITMDNDRLPKRIGWRATETGEPEKECRAMMLSLWDAADRSTLRIDLWTKDMRMDDMTQHFVQTLISQAEAYERATNTKNIASKMKVFCEELMKDIGKQMQMTQQKS